MMQNRIGSCKRKTKETDIELTINLDGQGKNQIDTGIPFFDHMLDGFARHGLFDLNVKVTEIWWWTVIIPLKIPESSLAMPLKKQSVTKRVSNVLEAVCFPWMRHWCFVRWIYPEDRIYPLMQNLHRPRRLYGYRR